MTMLEKVINDRGLRKDWVAEKIGVTPATLSRWLMGKMPRGKNKERLATFFGLAADYLFSTDLNIQICPYCGKPWQVNDKTPSNRKYCSKQCSEASANYSRTTAFKHYAKECRFCRSTEQLRAHHVSGIRADNSIENLVVLCQHCHTQLHVLIEKYKSRDCYKTATIKGYVKLASA